MWIILNDSNKKMQLFFFRYIDTTKSASGQYLKCVDDTDGFFACNKVQAGK